MHKGSQKLVKKKHTEVQLGLLVEDVDRTKQRKQHTNVAMVDRKHNFPLRACTQLS